MKTKSTLLLTFLLFCQLTHAQTNLEKAAFQNYMDSCSVSLNKHFIAKEYDDALAVMDRIKTKYDKLDKKNKQEFRLDADLYYSYAAIYASKNDAKSTLKSLKCAMKYGKKKYQNVDGIIYPKYKDNPAFASFFFGNKG